MKNIDNNTKEDGIQMRQTIVINPNTQLKTPVYFKTINR